MTEKKADNESIEKEKILCPHCGKEINPAAMLGSMTSKKKKISSVKNGKLGGKPKHLRGGRPEKVDAKPESIKRREKRRLENKQKNNFTPKKAKPKYILE